MASGIPITPPRVPLIDERTGLIAKEWYLFLYSQYTQVRDVPPSLEDTQKGPLADVADLSSIRDQIQAMQVLPAYTPQSARLRYGAFCDTTTQTAAAINTAYGMKFNTTDLSSGVYVGAPTSRVYVDTNGIYNIQFSAQIDKTSGGTGLLWIWLRKNGVNVARSATQIRIQGNDAETVAAWNFLLSMNASDYFELMWEVDTTDIQLLSDVATAVHPAVPSVILTVTDNIKA